VLIIKSALFSFTKYGSAERGNRGGWIKYLVSYANVRTIGAREAILRRNKGN